MQHVLLPVTAIWTICFDNPNEQYYRCRTIVFLRSIVKANMKSYIPLETAVIFFSCELISKTGYWLGVCYSWFHLHGQMKSIVTYSDLIPCFEKGFARKNMVAVSCCI